MEEPMRNRLAFVVKSVKSDRAEFARPFDRKLTARFSHLQKGVIRNLCIPLAESSILKPIQMFRLALLHISRRNGFVTRQKTLPLLIHLFKNTGSTSKRIPICIIDDANNLVEDLRLAPMIDEKLPEC
jgi:hypothetical protein